MTAQEHFWFPFYGWCLALGFILTVLVIAVICAGVSTGSVHNPLGPLIRWIDRYQEHRLEMSRIKVRAKLTRDIDPDYVRFLEDKTGKEQA